MCGFRPAATCRNCLRCSIHELDTCEILYCCPTEKMAQEVYPLRDRRWKLETWRKKQDEWKRARTMVEEGMVCDEFRPSIDFYVTL